MTGLAWWLLGVGIVDLFRARHDGSTPVARAVLAAIASLWVLAGAVGAGPVGGVGWTAWLVAAVLAGVWVLASGRALAGASAVTAAGVAYAAALGAIALLGLAGTRTGEPDWAATLLADSVLADVGPDRVLVALAALLVQVSTANIAIRMLLDLVGVPAQDNEKSLRGGRVLGPMERLVIVGLGLGGSLTGATVVVAAKALLRFPELRAGGAGNSSGASDVTEYFLIGSFASWILAFAGVALASA